MSSSFLSSIIATVSPFFFFFSFFVFFYFLFFFVQPPLFFVEMYGFPLFLFFSTFSFSFFLFRFVLCFIIFQIFVFPVKLKRIEQQTKLFIFIISNNYLSFLFSLCVFPFVQKKNCLQKKIRRKQVIEKSEVMTFLR